ncbi:unnamed protein product, partial [Closterium sp. NIES-54]
MASLRVLAFDHEGRPIQFDTSLDDLQLYLLSDSRDSVLLFDHTSGAAPAPPATADSATRSQWITRDAAARSAIRNHLPLAECAHFGQHRTAQALYDAVDARHSSPATASLGHLLLPYLFPELSAFATIKDLVSHLRTSDARYCAALLAEFLAKNPPPMYVSLYFIVTRLPDSLRAVGVVAGVGALVVVVEAAMGVAVVAPVGLELSVEVLEEVRGRGNCVGARPRRPSSFVSGCFSVGRLGRPHWAELLRSRVAIFDLDYDAILSAMYDLSASTEGDCYLCVPPDPGIEATALGASESALPRTALAEALHILTLDSGASRYFFRDSTTLTPLTAPVPVRLADPSGGPVVARSSTVLPCPA